MKCPRCKGPTHVENTRTKEDLVQRDRLCGPSSGDDDGCGWKFTTIEQPEGQEIQVVVRTTRHGIQAEVK